MQLPRALGRKPEAMHASVELQPDPQGRAPVGFEHPQLFVVVHDGVDAKATQLRKVAWLVETRQEHDALGKPRGTQPFRIGKRRDTEGIGAFERVRHAFQPVSVAIRLHHGQHPTVRCQGPHPGQVVAQRADVDGGDGGTGHGPGQEFAAAAV